MVMSLKQRISKGTFLYQVLQVASGNMLAQAIPFLVLPLLQSSFYTPAQFGILSLYTATSELFIGMASGKYEMAIVTSRRKKDQANLMFLCLTLSFVSAGVFLSGLILYFLGARLLHFWDEPALWLWPLPLSIAAGGIFNAISYRFNREQWFGRMSMGKVYNTLAAESTKIGLGIAHVGTGLVWGRIAGQLFSALQQWRIYARRLQSDRKLYSRRYLETLARSQRRYPLYIMPAALIGSLITVLYFNLFEYYYGEDKLGLIGVSASYIGVATGIISTAIGQVFFRKLAEIDDLRSLRNKYLAFAGVLAIPAALMPLTLYALPNSWVVYVLGDKWELMLPVARIMSLWMALAFISSSLSFIYLKLNMQRTMFVIDALHLLLVIGSIYLAHTLYGDFMTSLYFFTAAQLIHYLIAIFAALVRLQKISRS